MRLTTLGIGPRGKWLSTAHGFSLFMFDLTSSPSDPKLHHLASSRGGAKPHHSNLSGIEFDPGGRWLATCSADGEGRLWDLETCLSSPDFLSLASHGRRVDALAFSPDGRWLATTGRRVSDVLLWDLTAFDPSGSPFVLQGHNHNVWFLSFSPDGRWLGTADDQGFVRLWRLDVSELVQLGNRVAGRELTIEERQLYLLPARE